jgi:hypothetical protein
MSNKATATLATPTPTPTPTPRTEPIGSQHDDDGVIVSVFNVHLTPDELATICNAIPPNLLRNRQVHYPHSLIHPTYDSSTHRHIFSRSLSLSIYIHIYYVNDE